MKYGNPLRIMSYNIHKGIGGIDRKYKPERIINTIEYYKPDIIFLQEVDDGVPRSKSHIQVKLIADALGYKYYVFQANVFLRNGCYGNAILSHHPIINHQDICKSTIMMAYSSPRGHVVKPSKKFRKFGCRSEGIEFIQCTTCRFLKVYF